MLLRSPLSYLLKDRHSITSYVKPAEARAGEAVLRLRNLNVRYRTGATADTPAVCDATFEIARGEIVGIFGPSGSGKTSLGLALLNLLPSTATLSADAIEFDGKNLLTLGERGMRSIRGRRIAMMHQEAALSLNPVLRVGRQISEVIRAHEACTRRERRERTLELLRSVDLAERFYDLYPHELSGGERHRVVVAQALACCPALVIADEPTAGLDSDLRAGLLNLILRFRTEMSVAFLVISHDQKMLEQIADRTLQMTAGSLREGNPLWRKARVATASNPIMGSIESSPEPLLSIRALSKAYRTHRELFAWHSNSIPALRRVSLSIRCGTCLGLTGPSGSGKSTLAKCIAGWESPDSGQILFHGEDLSKLSTLALQRARGRTQLVLQDSSAAFNPNLTAEEIVEEPLVIQRRGEKQERRALVKRLFLETGLEEDMLTRTPLTFSGGQRQRLAIARALIVNPELVIFDESTTGLDAATQEQVLQLLTQIKAARKLTYILISHNADLLTLAADTVATMRNGAIVNVVHRNESTQPLHNVAQGERTCDATALATGEPA